LKNFDAVKNSGDKLETYHENLNLRTDYKKCIYNIYIFEGSAPKPPKFIALKQTRKVLQRGASPTHFMWREIPCGICLTQALRLLFSIALSSVSERNPSCFIQLFDNKELIFAIVDKVSIF